MVQSLAGPPEFVRVKMTPEQFDFFTQAALPLLKARPRNMGMGDYKSWLADRLSPAEGFPKPLGITDFPIKITPDGATTESLLQDIKDILTNQNVAMQPLMRAIDVTSAGQTFDWSMHGLMTRVMIRNKGANSVWFAFDVQGPQVPTNTADLCWELQAQEALSIERCAFYQIGMKSSAGGTVHAIAFGDNSGANGGAVG